MNKIKKLFGDVNLTWPKLLIFAIVAGAFTALVCILPQVQDTSFHTIAVSFEVWVLFGIFIIMNSKSNMDSALKCFVFFLISQPLVYLIQVPFSAEGWGLFHYYRRWFLLTLACLPMGYIGYYIKKGKWWGYLILLPMIALTAMTYKQYFAYFIYCFPFYILTSLFCIAALLIYPNVLFDDKKIKKAGTAISALIIVVITVITLINPLKYPADLISEVDGKEITSDYQASLADDKYGDVSIVYIDGLNSYMVHADFKRRGQTELIVKAPDGTTTKYDLDIGIFVYDITEK